MKFGLLGQSLSHSFSQSYFTAKFREKGLDHYYLNFELPEIEGFPRLLEDHPDLKGLNVTIPYKEAILPYLDHIDEEAQKIGAVNTIDITDGKTKGYNTDIFGFRESLIPLLTADLTQALVLGTGGASRAVAHVLKQSGIHFRKVSRSPREDEWSYPYAGEQLKDFLLLINTTPLGTYPEIHGIPPLDLDLLGKHHLCYDLIYNPPQTLWLQKAAERGAKTKNGLEMLELQAEKAWEVWNEL